MPDWPVSSRFTNWLRRWRALRPWEQRVLAQIAWRLPCVWVQLRVLGFKKTHCLIEANSNASAVEPLPDNLTKTEYAQRCVQLTDICAHHGLYRANCLHQSLALCSILRKMGLEAKLRIGVSPGSATINAHAWVELDGVALGKPVSGYRVFSNLDSRNELPTEYKY